MARPQPTILQDRYDQWEHYATLLQPSVFLLTYDGQLVTLKQTNTLTGVSRYPNTVLTTRKPAENLARKLNQQYNTTLYNIREIKPD